MKPTISKKTIILEGRSLATEILNNLDKEVGKLKNNNIHPNLAVIQIGDNEDNDLFIRLKKKQAESIGIDFSLYKTEESDSEADIIELIEFLNNDKNTNGIIIQLPIDKKYDSKTIISKIDKDKDVDALNSTKFISATALAVKRLIEKYNLPLNKVLIIGKGILVGQPLSKLFNKQGIEYTIWDKKSFKKEELRKFTTIICATGSKNIITKEDKVEKSFLIDASGKDLNFDNLYDHVEGITPLIGGVGPLTIAYLLKNTIKATIDQNK